MGSGWNWLRIMANDVIWPKCYSVSPCIAHHCVAGRVIIQKAHENRFMLRQRDNRPWGSKLMNMCNGRQRENVWEGREPDVMKWMLRSYVLSENIDMWDVFWTRSPSRSRWRSEVFYHSELRPMYGQCVGGNADVLFFEDTFVSFNIHLMSRINCWSNILIFHHRNSVLNVFLCVNPARLMRACWKELRRNWSQRILSVRLKRICRNGCSQI